MNLPVNMPKTANNIGKKLIYIGENDPSKGLTNGGKYHITGISNNDYVIPYQDDFIVVPQKFFK